MLTKFSADALVPKAKTFGVRLPLLADKVWRPTFRYNIFTNRNWKVRTLHVLNHIGLFYALSRGWTPLFFLSFITYFFMFCIGVNVGVHRYFSHRSFEASKASEIFMGFCMCIATLGSPFAWVGMHRAHHRYSDTPKDPHTPYINSNTVTLRSFLGTYIGYWTKYHASLRNVRDLKTQDLHKIMHFYYLAIIFAYVGVLFLIKPSLVIYMYCIPAVLCFHAASWIVTVGHVFGRHDLPTRDHSRNNLLLHWITFGEGLHNMHHAHPNAYYFQKTPWYFPDLPGIIIHNFFKKPNVGEKAA